MYSCSGASSAPLQGLVNFHQFKELAGAAYNTVGGQECYKTIEEGFSSLEEYLANGRNDLVEKVFTTCDPITTAADINVFKVLISELFTLIPQLNQ